MQQTDVSISADEPSGADPAGRVDARLAKVSTLVSALGDTPPPPSSLALTVVLPMDNQLGLVRLGVAGNLFAALRARHIPTAQHSLRVALNCSAWAAMLGLSDVDRDELEVAALLHDIGKICIPDAVLLKPAKLTSEEYLVIERHRQSGTELLAACCASTGVLQIVQYASGWFDGSREGHDLRGEQLPLGARVVAIADAFDAMTCDQVYRRALSHERAVAELFEFAGTQFDPQLVEAFCNYVGTDQVKLHRRVARKWLKALEPTNEGLAISSSGGPANWAEGLFYRKLLESMHDAVILVDGSLKIMLWNQAAERLTGIASASIEHRRWAPDLIKLHDERGGLIDGSNCPLTKAAKTGVSKPPSRLSIQGRGGQRIDIKAQLVPVHAKNGVLHGVAFLMDDASRQVTLEEQVQALHEKAVRDPLTQVANRTEFDRVLANYVESHLARRLPCSLIMCDIDHFKQVNDTFGHQAGDEVLIMFAAMLRRHCRSGDLIARYGGEEFVLVCADCGTTTAARRAEELRIELAGFPMPALSGKCITCSFGVTQVQSGDTPHTMVRRADRALYQAKANGRNTVVQLGSGIDGATAAPASRGWLAWLWPAPAEKVIERVLSTSVPLNIAIEKVRGFVADHHAQVELISENHVVVQTEGDSSLLRRQADRAMPFIIEMRFEESRTHARRGEGKVVRTVMYVAIRPHRSRDRRRGDLMAQAQLLLASLKSYLMAWDFNSAVPAADESAYGDVDQNRPSAAAE
jgi:diguanylate cyclase (GGDEF)-like protein/PAS domain S-box-containing protein